MNTYECAAAGQLLDSNFNDLNPYRSPAESADLVAAEVVSEVVIASSGKRLLNYFVDYFGMLAMLFVGGRHIHWSVECGRRPRGNYLRNPRLFVGHRLHAGVLCAAGVFVWHDVGKAADFHQGCHERWWPAHSQSNPDSYPLPNDSL